MKRRWWLWITIGLVLVGAAGVAFEPTGVVLGYLTRESFYRGRPARYWGRMLRTDDPVLQSHAFQALRDGKAEAVPVLVELLRDRRDDWTGAEVRWRAASLLGEVGPEARTAVPALIEALQDGDPHVRTVAATSLAAVAPGDPETVTAFTGLLHGPDRLVAVRALARCGAAAAPAVPDVIGLLQDAEPNVRWNAARTLGLIGPPARAAVPALVATLKDHEAFVREHAAEALGDLGPAAQDAVPALIGVLKDKDARVRRDAARSLGQIGPAAAPAVPTLRGLLKDENARVRDAADKALKQLTE
jgi:HEAT repeat protein